MFILLIQAAWIQFLRWVKLGCLFLIILTKRALLVIRCLLWLVCLFLTLTLVWRLWLIVLGVILGVGHEWSLIWHCIYNGTNCSIYALWIVFETFCFWWILIWVRGRNSIEKWSRQTEQAAVEMAAILERLLTISCLVLILILYRCIWDIFTLVILEMSWHHILWLLVQILNIL